MPTRGSVTLLLQALRSRDPGVRDKAARQIWRRHLGPLLALARANLDARVRRREDEEDVLQSMYRSFCLRQRRGDYDLADRGRLWDLLVTITLRKARNAARRHRCGIRDIRREQAGPGPGGGTSGPQCAALEAIAGSDPAPPLAVILGEALEQRLVSLADPALRHIALRKLEGCTNREIAAERGVTERSVERKLQMIRSQWASNE